MALLTPPASTWVPRDAELIRFLAELGLAHFAYALESEGLQVSVMKMLPETQLMQVLQEVGVKALGARIAIRHALKGS